MTNFIRSPVPVTCHAFVRMHRQEPHLRANRRACTVFVYVLIMSDKRVVVTGASSGIFEPVRTGDHYSFVRTYTHSPAPSRRHRSRNRFSLSSQRIAGCPCE